MAARNAPHRLIVISNNSGKFELHARDLVTGKQNQITDRSHGTLFGSVSPDGKHVFYLDDAQGNEQGHFVCIPFLGGKKLDLTPDAPNYFSYSVSMDYKETGLAFTASMQNEHHVYFVPFSSNGMAGNPAILYVSQYSLSEAIISPDGERICIAETVSGAKPKTDLILINQKTRTVRRILTRLRSSWIPLALSENTKHKTLLALTNSGGFYKPIFIDVETGKKNDIAPKKLRGDTVVLGWDETRAILILSHIKNAVYEIYQWHYLKGTLERIGSDHGSFDAYFGASGFLPNGSVVLKWEQFDVPGCLITISPRGSSWAEFDAPSSVASPRRKLESARIQSSDAARVQVWTALPEKFVKPGRFVIDIHGGPHGVAFDSFNPEAHAWLDSGFGYCAVNYRGSIGFGKKFMEKIYGNPGHWEVEDIVAARNWLVESGLADSRSIIISGWSWGGFVVLLALGKYPNLWAGGISGAGIADFLLQYEDEPAFFKATDDQRFGGAPDKVRKRYIRSSPITYASRIQAPICIIHGKNDARCPARQMRAFIKTMKRLKKKIETHWFSSGHAGEYANIKLRVKNTEKIISFAKKVVLPQDRS